MSNQGDNGGVGEVGKGGKRCVENTRSNRHAKTEEHDAFLKPRVAREHRTLGFISRSAEGGKEGRAQSTEGLTVEIGWVTVTGQSLWKGILAVVSRMDQRQEGRCGQETS